MRIRLVLMFAFVAGSLASGAADAQNTPDETHGPAVAALIEQLDAQKYPDDQVRRRAAYALGQIDPPPQQAVDALVKALSDRQMETRWYAIDALGQLGPAAAKATPEIVRSLESKLNDASVRRRGARSLGRIGPAAKAAVPVLEEALASDDLIYRVEAALALWRIQRDDRAVSALVDLLGRDDAEAAFAAALALSASGDRSPKTIDALVKALGHGDADVRQAAVFALAQIGEAAIASLSETLRTNGAINRRDAATALGMILAALRERVLYNDQASQRDFAAAAQPVVRQALPALAGRLGDDDAEIRDAAGLAMAKAGSAAVPELLRALQSADAPMRSAAAAALARLEAHLPRQRPLPGNIAAVHERILPQLIPLLAQEDLQVRRAAVRLFVALEIGPEGQAAQPHLRDALQSSDLATRRDADKALARLRKP